MIHGITEASTHHGITAVSTTHGISEAYTILGTMEASMDHGITCIRTMPDGMADGTTRIGDTTIIITSALHTVRRMALHMARHTSLTMVLASTPEPATAQVLTG